MTDIDHISNKGTTRANRTHKQYSKQKQVAHRTVHAGSAVTTPISQWTQQGHGMYLDSGNTRQDRCTEQETRPCALTHGG